MRQDRLGALDHGTVVKNGRTLDVRTPADAIAAGLAYLPEDRKDGGLFAEMTVAGIQFAGEGQNAMFGRRRVSSRHAISRAYAAR